LYLDLEVRAARINITNAGGANDDGKNITAESAIRGLAAKEAVCLNSTMHRRRKVLRSRRR